MPAGGVLPQVSASVLAALTLLPGRALAGASASASAPPRALTTEHADSGVQVDVAQPRFSWQDENAGQSAYQIRVTAGRHAVWDSGKVASADETDIAYAGPALQSDATYSWSVRVWDAAGRASAW